MLVPSDQPPVNRMYWTVLEAVDLLSRAYLVDLGGRAFMVPDPITLKALARALDARPEVLEQVWQAWEAQLVKAGWPEAHRDEASYWLDAVVIGGIAHP